jgi:excinuclease ABC subunit B
MSRDELKKVIDKIEKQMRKAAAELDFETAAMLRDKMIELKRNLIQEER